MRACEGGSVAWPELVLPAAHRSVLVHHLWANYGAPTASGSQQAAY